MVPDTSTMSSRRIVGYFANWRIYGRNFPVNKIQAANYTHVIYCFFGISSSTNQLISAGIPSGKVVLGIPVYGYAYANCTQLGSPNRGSASIGDGGILDLNQLYKQNLYFKTFYDASAGGAYSVCDDRKILVAHESDDTMKQKCEFIEKSQLGGAMLWHIATDWQDNTSLAKIAADRWKRHAD